MATTASSAATTTAAAPAATTQPTDLLLVQRGATAHKATAEQVKGYMLTPATTATIGGIKPGSNLTVEADGTLHADLPGALLYKGVIDPTTTDAPADSAVGDVYLASSSGVVLASWNGLAGAEISQGDLLLFDGSSWSANAALGPDGVGVMRVRATAPVTVEESDPAQPVISVSAATSEAAGVVRLASSADLSGGTAGAVVDAAQLAEAIAATQPAGDYMPLDISSLPALP